MILFAKTFLTIHIKNIDFINFIAINAAEFIS